jgi:uncharacterized protein DUF993
MAEILLPGRAEPTVVVDPVWAVGYPPPRTRSVYAAAHVAAYPDGSIDWASTMAFREHLWDYGFGLAEAMDTAQRGMGLSAGQAAELISRSAARAAQRGAAIASGVGTDQLADGEHPLPVIVNAYAEQLDPVQATGSDVIVMASRALAASARSGADYLAVYEQVLKLADRPVLLHWLGEAFDPKLAGYWGSSSFAVAADTVLELLASCPGRVRGIKLSVLNAASEIALRRALPAGVRLYTGDDYNYAELIKGDSAGHSDALLGVFAAITGPAAAALHALDQGDLTGYDDAMNPTLELSRCLFEPPTPDYKVGIAFLAWLNGFQPHFAMVGQLQQLRSPAHLIKVFELAAQAGALLRPELAIERLGEYVAGTAQA